MIQVREVPETPATRREEDAKVAAMTGLMGKALYDSTYPIPDDPRIAELEAAVTQLRERNATLEAIVTQRASRNATRQKAYRDRKRGQ